MTLGRVKKLFVCFSNVFFEINADPFWHFFPHWHLLLHILHEIMQIYKETKISEWLHHVYLYLSLLCRSNLSLSLGLSVPRSFICKPLSLLINYWWQIVELLANQKLLWKNGEVVGGVNHCQAMVMCNGVFHALEIKCTLWTRNQSPDSNFFYLFKLFSLF